MEIGGFKKKRQNLLGASVLIILLCYKYDLPCDTEPIKLIFTSITLKPQEVVFVLIIFNLYFSIRYFHSFFIREEKENSSHVYRWITDKKDFVTRLLVKVRISSAIEYINKELEKDVEKKSVDYQDVSNGYLNYLGRRFNKNYKQPLNYFYVQVYSIEKEKKKEERFFLKEEVFFPRYFKWLRLWGNIKFIFFSRLSSSLEYILPVLLLVISAWFLYVEYFGL